MLLRDLRDIGHTAYPDSKKDKIMMTEEILVTRPELAERFKVTVRTICRWQKQGKLKPVRLGSSTVRYRLSDVEAFLQKAAAQ